MSNTASGDSDEHYSSDDFHSRCSDGESIDSGNNESDSTADKGSGNGMLLDGMEDPSSEDSDEEASEISELAPELQEIKDSIYGKRMSLKSVSVGIKPWSLL